MRAIPARAFAIGLLAAAALPLAAAAQDQSATPPATTQSGNSTGNTSGDTGFDFGGSQPIEISADNGIEWNRDEKTYVAHGNAVASQGTSEVHSDMLVAYYGIDSNQIDHVIAEGSVKIISPNQTAYGDHADYDRVKRLLVMTGSNLKIQSTSETVTARDVLEYWQDQDAMVARGNVVIVKPDGTTIDGDEVTSYFRKNATTGKREAMQVKAEGHVKIDTGKEVATCAHAVYDPNTKIAVLTGNVVLTQNRSVFKGERAEIDMDKGVSRLLPEPGQRVRATIQPKQKSNQGQTPPASNAPTSAVPVPSAGSGPVTLDAGAVAAQ